MIKFEWCRGHTGHNCEKSVRPVGQENWRPGYQGEGRAQVTGRGQSWGLESGGRQITFRMREGQNLVPLWLWGVRKSGGVRTVEVPDSCGCEGFIMILSQEKSRCVCVCVGGVVGGNYALLLDGVIEFIHSFIQPVLPPAPTLSPGLC